MSQKDNIIRKDNVRDSINLISWRVDKDFSHPLEKSGYLEGQLLIATPNVNGDLFNQSVIYLFTHNSRGAMGLIINKPLEFIDNSALFQQLEIENPDEDCELKVYHGGPVDEHRGFILHSTDCLYPDSLTNENGLAITASLGILKEIATGGGPRDRMMVVGYAGWMAGQLEAEIEANSWITVPATPELIFMHNDENKWEFAASTIGVNMHRFSAFAGHA